MGKHGETRARIYRFLCDWMRTEGYAPSVREIGQAVGLSSTETVQRHLDGLEEEGLIRREGIGNRKRIVIVAGDDPSLQPAPMISVPLVGRVAAGEPILATENIEEMIALPPFLATSPDCFLLRVKGESMIGDGILDGDLVVVQPESTARNGEIIVALLDEEATVKRFFREPSRIRLQPSNERMEPIFARDVAVVGRVVGVLRQVH